MATERELLIRIAADIADLKKSLAQGGQEVERFARRAEQGGQDAAAGLRDMRAETRNAYQALAGLSTLVALFGSESGQAERQVKQLATAIAAMAAVRELAGAVPIVTGLGQALGKAAGEAGFAALVARNASGKVAELGLAAAAAAAGVSRLSAALVGLVALGVITIPIVVAVTWAIPRAQAIRESLRDEIERMVRANVPREAIIQRVAVSMGRGVTGMDTLAAATRMVDEVLAHLTMTMTAHERSARAVAAANKLQLDILDSLPDKLQEETTRVQQLAQVEGWSAAQTIKALEAVRDKYAANAAERLKMNALIASIREQEANRVKSAANQARAEQQRQFAEGLAQLQAEALLHGRSIDQQIADLQRYGLARAETAAQWRVILLAIHELELQLVQRLVKEGDKLGGIAREAARAWVQWAQIVLVDPVQEGKKLEGQLSETERGWVKYGTEVRQAALRQEEWLKQVRDGLIPGLKSLGVAIADDVEKLEDLIDLLKSAELAEALDKLGQFKTGVKDMEIGKDKPPLDIDVMKQILEKLTQMFGVWGEAVAHIVEGVAAAFGQFFQDVLSGNQSLGEALKNLWQNIASAIIAEIARMIVEYLIWLALTTITGFSIPFPTFLRHGDAGGIVQGPALVAVGPITEAFVPLSGPHAGRGSGMLAGGGIERKLDRIARLLERTGPRLSDIRFDRLAGLRYGLALSAGGIR